MPIPGGDLPGTPSEDIHEVAPSHPARCFKAVVEYDGTEFAGFQFQNSQRTVQGVLEAALALRMEQSSRVTGAGRTDAGVHAIGQVVSFSGCTRIPLDRLPVALNSALPNDLTIRTVEEVDPEFNARFSASSRVYLYLILNRARPSSLLGRLTAFYPHPLDVPKMREAAGLLLGERDFAAFAKELSPGDATMRNVMCCELSKRRDVVSVYIEANAFLRGMVRSIVGTLIEVGSGKRVPGSISELLATRDRSQAGPTAAPSGLYLLKVKYVERRQYTRFTQG